MGEKGGDLGGMREMPPAFVFGTQIYTDFFHRFSQIFICHGGTEARRRICENLCINPCESVAKKKYIKSKII